MEPVLKSGSAAQQEGAGSHNNLVGSLRDEGEVAGATGGRGLRPFATVVEHCGLARSQQGKEGGREKRKRGAGRAQQRERREPHWRGGERLSWTEDRVRKYALWGYMWHHQVTAEEAQFKLAEAGPTGLARWLQPRSAATE